MPRTRVLLLIAAIAGPPVACQRDTGPGTTVPASASSTVISLRGIDCQSCGTRVVAALKDKPGVYEAAFDLHLAEVTVQYDATQTGPDAFIATVGELGYTGLQGAGQGAYIPEVDFGAGLDAQKISDGEAVDLGEHVVPGKVTVFDFYAVWCKPCRKVDDHMKVVLAEAGDVALRKIDVVDWDSEVARANLRGVPDLPYVVVYGRDGKKVAEISGLHLDELDTAIEKARRR